MKVGGLWAIVRLPPKFCANLLLIENFNIFAFNAFINLIILSVNVFNYFGWWFRVEKFDHHPQIHKARPLNFFEYYILSDVTLVNQRATS